MLHFTIVISRITGRQPPIRFRHRLDINVSYSRIHQVRTIYTLDAPSSEPRQSPLSAHTQPSIYLSWILHHSPPPVPPMSHYSIYNTERSNHVLQKRRNAKRPSEMGEREGTRESHRPRGYITHPSTVHHLQSQTSPPQYLTGYHSYITTHGYMGLRPTCVRTYVTTY